MEKHFFSNEISNHVNDSIVRILRPQASLNKKLHRVDSVHVPCAMSRRLDRKVDSQKEVMFEKYRAQLYQLHFFHDSTVTVSRRKLRSRVSLLNRSRVFFFPAKKKRRLFQEW